MAAFTMYMQQEKAAEMTFVRKTRTFYVDEIDDDLFHYVIKEGVNHIRISLTSPQILSLKMSFSLTQEENTIEGRKCRKQIKNFN